MRRVLAGVVAVAVVALIGYGIGSYVLFDTISAVAAQCGARSTGEPRFAENTRPGGRWPTTATSTPSGRRPVAGSTSLRT